MEVIQILLNYAAAPLAAVCWYMFKRQDMRLDQLEQRTNDLERSFAKIEAELHFIGRDIQDIKEGIKSLSKQS